MRAIRALALVAGMLLVPAATHADVSPFGACNAGACR